MSRSTRVCEAVRCKTTGQTRFAARFFSIFLSVTLVLGLGPAQAFSLAQPDAAPAQAFAGEDASGGFFPR